MTEKLTTAGDVLQYVSELQRDEAVEALHSFAYAQNAGTREALRLARLTIAQQLAEHTLANEARDAETQAMALHCAELERDLETERQRAEHASAAFREKDVVTRELEYTRGLIRGYQREVDALKVEHASAVADLTTQIATLTALIAALDKRKPKAEQAGGGRG